MLKNINEHLQNEVSDIIGDKEAKFVENASMLEIHLLPENIVQIAKYLKEDEKLRFTCLVDLFGVDRLGQKKRFEVAYLLLSTKFSYRVCLKVHLDDSEQVPSLHAIYPNSIWFEREVFDMFGVRFAENPDMRRILTDYGFEGHPLRKDFPLTGFKQICYDYEQKKVVYEPVSLVQDYRTFDFVSPWEGTDYNLPGDEKGEKIK